MHNDDTNINDDVMDQDEPRDETQVSSGGMPAGEEAIDAEETSNETVEQAASGEEACGTEAPGEELRGEENKVSTAVGIRFEPCGKVYCFKANGMGLKVGEHVVVESELGISIGRVVVADMAQDNPDRELKPILRRVTADDRNKQEANNALKKEAFDFCNERIMARGLSMKLLGTEVTLDKRRIVFFFSADTRIDFRELVKDLAAKFRTRIELRQVGVRDAARITGGLGVCGRELCCRRFLTSFLPISIKMAKKQELALNTSKLSGICGRLMCCLGYEYEEKLKELKEKGGKAPLPREEEVIEPAVVEEPSQGQEPVEEVSVPAEPQTAEESPMPQIEGDAHTRKRRRRRRRRSGKKPGPEQSGGAQGNNQQRQEQRPSDEKTQSGGSAEGDASANKPFRRRRRRRMRGKKTE